MTDTKQKSAIVTGASKGIGAAIARRLASDGFAVVVNYAGSKDAAEEVARSIVGQGGKAVAVRADITDPAGMATLFDAADQAFGSVDVLVNNAGMMALAPLAETDDDSFARQIETNIGGVFRGIREAAVGCRMEGGSSICRPASSASSNPPTASMPQPRRRWRR